MASNHQALDIFKIFANDKHMILYRPEWRQFTGSVVATILLQQIIHLWDRNGRKPFFKFKESCNHRLYKSGDSWTEELGFSRKEFDGAIKKIGYKKSKKNQKKHSSPVEYWTEPSRLTFYTIHEENLYPLLSQIYQETPAEPEEAEAAETAQEVAPSEPTPQEELSQKPSDNPPDNSESPVKSKRDFTKSPKGTLRKAQKGLYEKPKRDFTKSPKGTLPVKSKRDFTKSPKGTLPNKDQRSSSEKEITSEREENLALALFSKNFPKITLNATQEDDIIMTATNLEAWKYTIWWWKFKAYRAERTDFMLDFYQHKAIPKLQQVTQHQTQEGKEQRSPPAPNNAISGANGDVQTLWNTVLQTLETRINRPSFNTWLKPTQLLSISDHSMQISVPDEIFVYWLEEHYENAIAEALSKTLGFQPKLSFIVESETPKQAEPEQTKLWE